MRPEICIINFSKKNTSIFSEMIKGYQKKITLFKLSLSYCPLEYSDHKKKEKIMSNYLFHDHKRPNGPLIFLDERGKHMSSVELSTCVEKLLVSHKKIHFVIGDATGFPLNILSQATHTISLSKLTFPHKMAELLLAEQLYRTQSILTKHPYAQIH